MPERVFTEEEISEGNRKRDEFQIELMKSIKPLYEDRAAGLRDILKDHPKYIDNPQLLESDIAEQLNIVADMCEPEGSEFSPSTGRQWKIVVNEGTLTEQTSIALDALSDYNSPPKIFNRGRMLVRIVYNEHDIPSIDILSESALIGVLDLCASWVKNADAFGLRQTIVYPPVKIAQNIMCAPEWNTIYPLTGITEVPIITRSGKIVSESGYNTETRLFYAADKSLKISHIPKKPTQTDKLDAILTLQEVFCDFPFVDDASRQNIIGLLITTIVRPMIDGCIPIALIDKPAPGTGASLISDVISIIATGRPMNVKTAPEDDAEWRKMITATLLFGKVLSIVDNVEGKLDSPALAALATSKFWEDRILSTSDCVMIPNNMIWIVTGNNIQLGKDIPRRCYSVRLDAKSAKPWQTDKKFKHPDLLEWVGNKRSDIIRSVLILAKMWINDGKKKQSKTLPKMGSFEDWQYVVGGIMNYCEFNAFLTNIESMYAESDSDTPQWESFVEQLYIRSHRKLDETLRYEKLSESFSTMDIIQLLQKEEDSANINETTGKLETYLPDRVADLWVNHKSPNRVLGALFKKMNGRITSNGYSFTRAGITHGNNKWLIERKIN